MPNPTRRPGPRPLPPAALAALVALALAAPPPAGAGVVTRTDEAFDGYTLLSVIDPFYRGGVPLIDMDGTLVHSWDCSGFPAVLLPGGSVLCRRGTLEDLPLGGSSVELVQLSWEGDPEWSFREFDEVPGVGFASRQTQDLQREGNPVGYYAPGQEALREGTTLVLAFEDTLVPAASPHPLVDGVVYEVDPGGEITWKWGVAGHLDQIALNDKARAEIAAWGDELFNVNAASWLGPNRHFRAGDDRFHPDNLLLHSRTQGFQIIVERATGDVVWQLGPDYDSEAEAALGPFVGDHQAHLIPEGLPGEGNVLLFDNGFVTGFGGSEINRTVVGFLSTFQAGGNPVFGYRYVRAFSRVVEYDPVTLEKVWTYDPREGDDLTWSPIISGAQRLPNGNTLITSGVAGRVVEVTPDRRIVWDYRNDFTGITPATYRAIRVPPDYLPRGENEAAGGYARWSSGGSSGGCALGREGGPDDVGPAVLLLAAAWLGGTRRARRPAR